MNVAELLQKGSLAFTIPTLIFAGTFLIPETVLAANQWTERGGALQSWRSAAASADGTRFVAVQHNGDIWTSADSGVTWTNQTTGTAASGLSWIAVASSNTGEKLVAAVQNGDVWTSTDYGVTWVNRTTGTSAANKDWRSIDSSGDGTKLVAVVYDGDIWTSADSGVTWTNQTTGTAASGKEWTSVTSSSNGEKLAAAASYDYGNNLYGRIWASTDSGATWNLISGTVGTPRFLWGPVTIDSSDDGSTLYVADGEGGEGLWRSTNSGTSWTQLDSLGNDDYRRVVTSGDGTVVAVTVGRGDSDTVSNVYLSTESGDAETWTDTTGDNGTALVDGVVIVLSSNRTWSGISMSANGAKLIVTTGNLWTLSRTIPDIVAPVISEVRAVPSGTNTSPEYTFSSDEAGTITYGGSCTSGTTEASVGENTINFSALPVGTYANCTIVVTDEADNESNILVVTEFRITPEERRSSSSSRRVYGCKDTAASNYNQFSSHRQELCRYAGSEVVAATSQANMPLPARDLEAGVVGEDVQLLQKLLNANGFSPASTGPGSMGNETTMFGVLTRTALAEYQAANAIVPAAGYFGPLTRAQMKASGVTGVWW